MFYLAHKNDGLGVRSILYTLQNGNSCAQLISEIKESFNWTERWGSVEDSPGAVCILMLIQLPQDGLPGVRSKSCTLDFM